MTKLTDLKNINKDTEQIILDLLGVLHNILNTEDSEYDGTITGVDFFIQDGYEAVPLWYIRREVIQYESGDRLHVIFRPNLKAKRLKPTYLRTAPERVPMIERGFNRGQ